MSSSHPENSEEPSGLLHILAAVFSGVLFGLFLSKLRTPIQESSESIRPEDTPEEESRYRKAQPPPVSQIPPAPSKNEGTNRSKDSTPLWKKYLEWGALLVAIGLLIVNIFQLRLTREQVHIGQRAYLVFRHPILTELPAQDQAPEVSVDLENSGQTPALDVRFSIILFVGNSPDAVPLPPESYVGYIGAGKELKPFSRMLNKLTQEEYSAVTSKVVGLEGNRLTIYNTQRLFVRAVVHYRDVFGVPGETTMCSMFFEKKELNGCLGTGWNEMKWEKPWW